ncbi:VOC family protein [Streptomyces sp. CA-146814]|uniref:VOC family protein n=1 Tax=Streptomyces sp. CA-146814 TaxID=3240053 RepID=UPI003D8F1B7F
MTRHGPLNEFCWMDLKTHDPSGTAAFFSSVLGWEFAVDEEDWRRAVKFSAGGHRIGGISDLAQPVYPPGTPAHIAYYLAVDDVDHRTAVAAENGAEILVPPFDAGDQGRIATLIDPMGAAFSLWRPSGYAGWPPPPLEEDKGGDEGAPRIEAAPHRMVLVCEDPTRARDFYTETAGTPLARTTFQQGPYGATSAPRWELAIGVHDVEAVVTRACAHECGLVTLSRECGRPRAQLRSPEGLTFRIHPLGL